MQAPTQESTNVTAPGRPLSYSAQMSACAMRSYKVLFSETP